MTDPSRQTRSRHPRIAVMILNFNGMRWLKICLPSVLNSSYPNLSFYVIDNGSADESCEFVKTKYPIVNLVRFGQNLGFAEAYNRTIRNVDADYVVLLNNDTEVLNPKWLEVLVDRAESDPTIAAVTCKLVAMDDHRILDSVGGMGIKYWRGFVDIGKHEVDRGQYDLPPISPFATCGAGTIIRKSAFEIVGGFDSKLYAYVEDVDLSWRLRLRGYRIEYEPSATVAHYLSGTMGREIDARKLYLTHRNLLRAILKNCGSTLVWALRNWILFTALLVFGFSIAEPRKTVALVRTLLWNIVNFRDIFSERLRIQGLRTESESEVLRKMYPGFERYRPVDHASYRRMLDILFEHRD